MVPGDDGRATYDLDGLDRAFASRRGGCSCTAIRTTRWAGCSPRPSSWRWPRWSSGTASGCSPTRSTRRWSTPAPSTGPTPRCRRSRPRHAVTATSASKAWNLPGLKAAQLLVSNEADARRWADVGFFAAHGTANLGVLANTAAYDEGEPWLDGVLALPGRQPSAARQLLAERLPEVRYTPPEGTYLAWLDCRGLGIEGSAGAVLPRAGGGGVRRRPGVRRTRGGPRAAELRDAAAGARDDRRADGDRPRPVTVRQKRPFLPGWGQRSRRRW